MDGRMNIVRSVIITTEPYNWEWCHYQQSDDNGSNRGLRASESFSRCHVRDLQRIAHCHGRHDLSNTSNDYLPQNKHITRTWSLTVLYSIPSRPGILLLLMRRRRRQVTSDTMWQHIILHLHNYAAVSCVVICGGGWKLKWEARRHCQYWQDHR